MSKHRDYVIQKRKKEAKQKKRIGAVLGFFMISIASIGFGAVFASAHGTSKEEPVSYKYYKSIEIKDAHATCLPGDLNLDTQAMHH